VSATGAHPASQSNYDGIGKGYARVRREDPRLAEAIWSALGDPTSVLNVGAGTGAYEPRDRSVVAVEPSRVMISQRPVDAAPVIRGVAESLPVRSRSVEAATAVLTIHHWADPVAGLREMMRVARSRVVIVTIDASVLNELWIVRDYLPEMIVLHETGFPPVTTLQRLSLRSRTLRLPVPRDCSDGFMPAFWGRPEDLLDPEIRTGASVWHQLPQVVVERAMRRLRSDLGSGEWDRRYGKLRGAPSLDVGLRLLTLSADPP
jgi:SAM-dependent methyltransferase